MSWTTVLWSMDAAACLTLATIHLVIGLRRRASANLLFSLMAVSAAVMAALELSLMHSPVPEVHAGIVRWAHAVFFVLFLSLVFFVRSYFRAGRTWLLWTVVAVRGVSVALNFLVDPNLNYVRITGVRPLRFLGETIYLTEGVFSERTRIAQLSSLLLLIYLVDATRDRLAPRRPAPGGSRREAASIVLRRRRGGALRPRQCRRGFARPISSASPTSASSPRWRTSSPSTCSGLRSCREAAGQPTPRSRRAGSAWRSRPKPPNVVLWRLRRRPGRIG